MFIVKLFASATLVLTLSLLVAGVGRADQAATPRGSAEEQAPPQPGKQQLRPDRLGDPLPPGAIARVGTARLWNGNGYLPPAFTRDGKILASHDGHSVVRLWDAATGKLLHRIHHQDERVGS